MTTAGSSPAGAPSLSFRLSTALNRAKMVAGRTHDMRIGRQPAYVDGSRSDQNVVLACAEGYDARGSGWSRFLDREAAQLEARRVRRTKAGTMWRSAILTFSRAAQELLTTPPDVEARRVFEDFSARHGVRLLWAIGHRDESAAHFHAMFENVASNGMSLDLDRAALAAEQDIAASHFAHLGIVRGKKKTQRMLDGEDASTFIHRSVRELHRDLPAELEAARSALADTFASIEKHQARAEAARLKAEEYAGDAQKAMERVQRYEERARHAQARWEALQGQIEDLEARCERLRDVAIPAMREILDREGFTDENLDLMARMDADRCP